MARHTHCDSEWVCRERRGCHYYVLRPNLSAEITFSNYPYGGFPV